jgi:hypothetical protein
MRLSSNAFFPLFSNRLLFFGAYFSITVLIEPFKKLGLLSFPINVWLPAVRFASMGLTLVFAALLLS